ncbi:MULTISPECIES: competence type IV pilus minor pilin ComGF [Robertmurraya]|uniref:competence type IV pilus minor pilin ComGF n=1 Tax=Robertmurraya TaxID=2837507 RepID=UPI0022A66FD4|nr:competence type IV pilus minor pilin ComGF [Robertmurraya siralis]
MKTLLQKRGRNANDLSESGFTMLEMLFSFSIFCLMISFLPLLFQIIFYDHAVEARIQKMEWELFISQTKKDIQSSDHVEVVNGELILIKGEESISYQKYQNVLRKQVNRKGHEVVLQNVASVTFSKEENAITIEVKDLFHHFNQATIFSFISSVENGVEEE